MEKKYFQFVQVKLFIKDFFLIFIFFPSSMVFAVFSQAACNMEFI